jgi:starch synthase (maltosyl-transferring)
MVEGRKRIVIENVRPEINSGAFLIKRVINEKVIVEADIFADGHDEISARLLYRRGNQQGWNEGRMKFIKNDRWRGEFVVEEIGRYVYTIISWVDHFRTWRRDLIKKFGAGQDIGPDIRMGIEYMEAASARASHGDQERLQEFSQLFSDEADREKIVALSGGEELCSLMDNYADRGFVQMYEKELSVIVDRERALFSSWYEIFPRSCAVQHGRHGTFSDCEALLPEIQRMGFDVLYLPPIHPIGRANRKGKNNSLQVSPDDVGSPWAIGSEEGGHKAVHSELGTVEDFIRLTDKAKEYGLEVAMDIAFQCSPDHPYVGEHPEWFRWRPDGTVQYAENPPKRYEDILPLNFETERWWELWNELKSIVIFWIEKGIRIFRVDNPHTKPFPFWEWLINEIKRDYPEVIFLSEAFTRPKVMYYLAKLGFTQSYTYFAWRNTKWELTQYINELAETDIREFFRPNFWPNTPDILPEHLQYGGRNAFTMRLALAATLSSNYGIYGPAFELTVNEAVSGKEEYLNSEKYEIKRWDRDKEGHLKDFIARVNKIRRENPALQQTFRINHYEADNENIMFYGKTTDDFSNIILVAVNLDPFHTHSAWVKVPIHEFGIEPDKPYLVHDLLGDDKFIWQGERNYIEINPHISPAYIFRLRKKLKKEMDFDYFM